jgi:gamma-glutamyl:cysteine ligase YbdK (ATP-grasp superfamily)
MELRVMGKDISQLAFTQNDFNTFQNKLYQQLDQLKEIITYPEFGQGDLKIGAELEMYLVDDDGNVSLSNRQLLTDLQDEQFQPELNQYNIELNLSAFSQHNSPFTQLRNEILTKTGLLEKTAAKRNINIIPIGILPTLKKEHLNAFYMTDVPRYHCLSKYLYQQRGEDFKININGEEPVSVSFKDICAEGANTSFQVHLMVKPESLCQTFNAAQLTIPLVTAVAANSGIFLGNRVWDETRIALFKQSLDIRLRDKMQWQEPTRVNFGFGWLRHNIWELFSEAVALYQPILPEITAEVDKQTLPELAELNLHMGTIWPWHRPVFSNHENGHIRIEFRAIPAGPTSLDMVANAAYAIGLAIGISDDIEQYLNCMPFRFAEYNFYRAAQHGLDANILWPHQNRYQPKETPITDVIRASLPIALRGLLSLGIEHNEAKQFLDIIEQRLEQHMTGAIWQKQTLQFLEKNTNKQQACQLLVQQYIAYCRSCQPVATWDRLWT